MTGSGRHPGLVLVVEDDPAILALCRVTLERARQALLPELRVLEASNLENARRIAATVLPDLVVMDVLLPDGNGLDLVRELRQRGIPDPPKVIIASASVLPAEREAALAAGADRFLPKPYRPADLVAAVVELLGDEPA